MILRHQGTYVANGIYTTMEFIYIKSIIKHFWHKGIYIGAVWHPWHSVIFQSVDVAAGNILRPLYADISQKLVTIPIASLHKLRPSEGKTH